MTAAVTWQLDQLSQRFPDASRIMKIVSFLDRESFDVDLFTPKKAGSVLQINKEEEVIYVSTLNHVKSELGPKYLKMLQAIQDLARVYGLQGRYTQAETLFSSALRETPHLFRFPRLRTLRISQNLAIVYMDLGLYDEAER